VWQSRALRRRNALEHRACEPELGGSRLQLLVRVVPRQAVEVDNRQVKQEHVVAHALPCAGRDGEVGDQTEPALPRREAREMTAGLPRRATPTDVSLRVSRASGCNVSPSAAAISRPDVVGLIRATWPR